MIIKFNCLLTIDVNQKPKDYEKYCIHLEEVIEKALEDYANIKTAEAIIEEI